MLLTEGGEESLSAEYSGASTMPSHQILDVNKDCGSGTHIPATRLVHSRIQIHDDERLSLHVCALDSS